MCEREERVSGYPAEDVAQKAEGTLEGNLLDMFSLAPTQLESFPSLKDKGHNERRNTRRCVNHNPTCKIFYTLNELKSKLVAHISQIDAYPGSQPSFWMPDPVRKGIVNENGPQDDEHNKCVELHLLRPSASNNYC